MKADIDILSGLHRRDLNLNELEIRAFLENPPEQVKQVPYAVLCFFAERGLLLTDCIIQDKMPKNSDAKLSENIRTHYDVLAPFCRKYVLCMYNSNASSHFVFCDYTNENLPILKNFCSELKKCNALNYEIFSEHISADIPPETHKNNLLNGGWGEYATVRLINKTLSEFSLSKTILTNLKFKRAVSDSKIAMELDVAVLLNKSHLYIFESKCGTILAVDKWIDRTRIFESPEFIPGPIPNPPKPYPSISGHFITCTPRSDIDARYFLPYRLICLDNFVPTFKEILLHTFGTAYALPPNEPQSLIKNKIPSSLLSLFHDNECSVSISTTPIAGSGITAYNRGRLIHSNILQFNSLCETLTRAPESETFNYRPDDPHTENEESFIRQILQFFAGGKTPCLHVDFSKTSCNIKVKNKTALLSFIDTWHSRAVISRINASVTALGQENATSGLNKTPPLRCKIFPNIIIRHNIKTTKRITADAALLVNDSLLYIFTSDLKQPYTTKTIHRANNLIKDLNLTGVENTITQVRYIMTPVNEHEIANLNDYNPITRIPLEDFPNTFRKILQNDLSETAPF